MKINLIRQNDAVLFEGSNEEGNTVTVDGGANIGGVGKGMRPMELLLVSLAGCTSMDVVTILQKMRQPLENFRVEVNGERQPDVFPAVFEKIHVHFVASGKLSREKVERAISKSMDTYCSVSRMIEKVADITWSLELE